MGHRVVGSDDQIQRSDFRSQAIEIELMIRFGEIDNFQLGLDLNSAIRGDNRRRVAD